VRCSPEELLEVKLWCQDAATHVPCSAAASRARVWHAREQLVVVHALPEYKTKPPSRPPRTRRLAEAEKVRGERD
jgi:hypothetical protein